MHVDMYTCNWNPKKQQYTSLNNQYVHASVIDLSYLAHFVWIRNLEKGSTGNICLGQEGGDEQHHPAWHIVRWDDERAKWDNGKEPGLQKVTHSIEINLCDF